MKLLDFLRNQQTFHDGPKMAKNAAVIVILSIFKLIFCKALLRYNIACASVINVYHKLINMEICNVRTKQDNSALIFPDKISIESYLSYARSIISTPFDRKFCTATLPLVYSFSTPLF